MPDIDNASTELDIRQPDGIPKTPERGADGKFVAADKPSHPAGLIGLAKDLGFSDEEIAGFSTDSLSTAIRRTRANMESARQQFSRPEERLPTPQAPEPEFSLGDLKDYDEGVASVFTKLQEEAKENRKALKELRAELAKTKASDEDRSIKQAKQLCDDAFEAMGPEYAEYFGVGTGDELRTSDPDAFRRRINALEETKADTRVVSGKALLKKLKHVTESVLKVAAKQPGTQTKPKVSKEEWDRGGTAVPTQRNGATEPKGPALARDNLAKTMREQGLNTSAEDREIYDTLPKR